MPENFSENIRDDVILKVFEAQKRKQPMGTYVWTCSYYDNFEKRQKEKVGNVTIIR